GAQLAQDARGLARAELLAALEHHVLQGVGQAGQPGLLITGADLVPELGNHHRGAMVFAHDHLQAVVQGEFVGGLGRCPDGRQWPVQAAEQKRGAAQDRVLHEETLKGDLCCGPGGLTPPGDEVLGYPTPFPGGHARAWRTFEMSGTCLVPTTTRSPSPRLARRKACSAGGARNRRRRRNRKPSLPPPKPRKTR